MVTYIFDATTPMVGDLKQVSEFITPYGPFDTYTITRDGSVSEEDAEPVYRLEVSVYDASHKLLGSKSVWVAQSELGDFECANLFGDIRDSLPEADWNGIYPSIPRPVRYQLAYTSGDMRIIVSRNTETSLKEEK